ncbi:MAG: outer membrane beta-barrel protein [Polaromonas sp.]|uniref:outer membrane beta-barrel protein n=1 Tax=Polaromonas sp. TaxID=1869339 RepID=UPI0027303D7E|nr:outer membrane beta-barrel protein [Polaromonas sp.]MDP2447939.1 outer membrane beta-barrel protein [Polaromonas sp.]MDP3249843.1 outer membrane beta-barrel protein [Polaromonas sp.]MDP3757480.1 outer membrane beta-barrel protein [Polaromonas sp.]
MTASKFPSARRGLGLIALAVLGTVSSSWVIAQDETTGPYIGGNVGRTRANFNNDSINQTLVGQGLRVGSATEDNSGTGYKLFGGYQLNRNFAVEGGYFDLGKSSYTVNANRVTDNAAGTFNGETRVRGLNLDLVGMLPVSDRFSVFGRVGAAYAQSRASFNSTGAVPVNTSNTRRNDTNLKVGLGMQYAITEALAVRGELERYRINDPVRNRGHIDMASLGLVYRFGPKAQTPVAQAYVPPAPVYVAPPAPPAPVYVAPPPPPPVVVAPQPVYEPPARPAKQGRN